MVTAFTLASTGQRVLVNRGWVPQSRGNMTTRMGGQVRLGRWQLGRGYNTTVDGPGLVSSVMLSLGKPPSLPHLYVSGVSRVLPAAR